MWFMQKCFKITAVQGHYKVIILCSVCGDANAFCLFLRVRRRSRRSMTLHSAYQAEKDTKELNDVCVSDRVEAADEGVEHGHAGGQHDGAREVQVEDDREGGAWAHTRRH